MAAGALPPGTIDCDIHPSVPGMAALLPFMPGHWADMVRMRGLDELNSISYPAGSPLTARADWRPAEGKPAGSVGRIKRECLDAFGTELAICHVLYGVQMLFSEDMEAAFAHAVNDWTRASLLDVEPRLRAGIVLPTQSVPRAVEEIERCAGDPRFVQVLLLASLDQPLGKRVWWPVYEAARKHGLAVGIHAGGNFHNPPTAVGWPSTHTEEVVAQAQAFQSQLTSLICEGVFSRFPDLKVVMLESGWTWLPAHLWRLTKYWRGLRMEIPWVDRAPADIVRSNVRFSLTPTDAPAHALAQLISHLPSDELLLFSTDYPHGHFEGADALPAGLPDHLLHKICVENPRATYARLLETVP